MLIYRADHCDMCSSLTDRPSNALDYTSARRSSQGYRDVA